jgi:hypothetical protein
MGEQLPQKEIDIDIKSRALKKKKNDEAPLGQPVKN